MSQRDSSTDAGDVNRRTEMERGNSGTGTEFGKNIGRSENLGEKGGNTDMRNRDQENMNQDRSSSEETRRPSGDSGFGSSSGRSSGSVDSNRGSSGINSDRDLNESSGDRSRRGGSMGSSGNSSSGSSSSDEH